MSHTYVYMYVCNNYDIDIDNTKLIHFEVSNTVPLLSIKEDIVRGYSPSNIRKSFAWILKECYDTDYIINDLVNKIESNGFKIYGDKNIYYSVDNYNDLKALIYSVISKYYVIFKVENMILPENYYVHKEDSLNITCYVIFLYILSVIIVIHLMRFFLRI